MGGLIFNTPTANNIPTILLYSFTQKEQETFRFLLRGFPGIRLLVVPGQAYDCCLHKILNKPLPVVIGSTSFSRHMLVLAHIPDPLVHPLLAICKQATPEKVLKAMLTETNQNWTSRVLYENLLDEEAQLGG